MTNDEQTRAVERPAAAEAEGRIAGELVGKIAEMVGARPVFASDLLSQEELLAAVKLLTSPPAPSGWQPIESAPNPISGTTPHNAESWRSFLVWCPANLCQYLVVRRAERFSVMGGGLLELEPTHWMPRPSGPWQNAKDALPPSSGWTVSAEALTMDLWQRICELPDRTSPDSDPDAALVTLEELRLVVDNIVEDALLEQRSW